MKSITTRRAIAASLTVVGLSGLGLAAAAQLNMTWAGSFQAGATVVKADCQTGPIATKLGSPIFDGTKAVPWSIAAITFNGVSASCTGMHWEVAYKTGAGNWNKIKTGEVGSETITVILGDLDAQTISDVSLTMFS